MTTNQPISSTHKSARTNLALRVELSCNPDGDDIVTTGEFWRAVASLTDLPKDPLTLLRPEAEVIRIGDHVAKLRTSSDILTCIEMVHPQGFGPPEHIHHKEDEIFLVRRGNYTFKVGDQIIDLEPGAMLLAPKGVPHTFRTGADGGATIVVTLPGGFEFFLREVAAGQSTDLATLARKYGIEFVGPPISDRFWARTGITIEPSGPSAAGS